VRVAGSVLLRAQRAWPWGLIVITDPTTRDELPQLGEESALAGRSTIVARILHEVDGEALGEMRIGPAPALTPVLTATIDFPSGTVAMTDAAFETTAEATLDPGEWIATVSVDDAVYPTHVFISLVRP
jgi:hypothetical protein